MYDGKIRIKTELDNGDVDKLKEELADLKKDAQNIGTNQENIDAFVEKFESFKDSYNDAKKIDLFEEDINSLNELEQGIGEVASIAANSYNSEWVSELDSLIDGYNEIKNSKIFTDDDVAEAETIKENIKEMVKDLEKTTGIKLNIKGITDESERAKFNFKEIGNHLIKVGISLLGVRTIFSSLSKASNAYLSQHTETAAKLQSIWIALGNLVGPIIEMIANGVLKIVGYLNVFIKSLTNGKIDLTKGMNKNTKSVKETTKAMKELNKQKYAFDEMNIEQDLTSSSSGVGNTGIDSGDVDFKMPELDPKIVEKLKDLAHWLQENWDWIWKVGAALGAVFGIAKISGLLGNIGSLIGGSGTGLLGLQGILAGLLAMELITITISIIYYSQELKKVKQDNENLVKWNKAITKENDKVNKSNLEKVKTYEKGSKAINDYTAEIIKQIDAEYDSISAHQEQNDEMSILDNMFDVFGGTRAKNNELTKESTQRIIDNVAKLQELAKEGKLTDEQMKVYNQTMAKLTETQKSMTPFIEWNSWAFDKETLQIYNQINALKENEKQFSTTTSKNKNNVLDIYNFTKTKFAEMTKLKATPTVEFKANTKKLSSVFETLSKSNFLGGGLMSSFLTTANKLKSLGMDHGGIFNLPGRGIPIGANVVVGEKRREGVLPLEDASTMAELGYEIGKNVVVNLTNENYLNNRLIGRESKRISNQTAYLTNGRVM